nr:hypothetical protein [uncultured Draconibacterium sp.]
MMIVKKGGLKVAEFGNQTIQGINFLVRLAKKSSNNEMGTDWFDLSSVFVKIKLLRNNKVYDIISTNLKVLAIESSFETSTLGMAIENGSYVDLLRKPVSSAGPEIKLLPLVFDLGSILNLRRDDKLSVEVNMQTGFLTDNAVAEDIDENGTYIEVSSVEAVGKEYQIPMVKIIPIGVGENRIEETLGSNVQKISYVNTDIKTYYEDQRVIRNFSVQSDKLYITDNYEQLIAKQFARFDNLASASSRAQCFNIYDGIELDDCRIDMDLFGERITSGNNYIIYRTFYTDVTMQKLAQVTNEIHAVKNGAKVGMDVPVSKSLSSLEKEKEDLIKSR